MIVFHDPYLQVWNLNNTEFVESNAKQFNDIVYNLGSSSFLLEMYFSLCLWLRISYFKNMNAIMQRSPI